VNRWDAIVIGAGHAGVEAALAAARLGARVAMVSGNLDTVAKMSCNPAIGGVAKGQLAREVDALGGAMGLAADATGIHFKTLGTSKGPAMWSPRAQCDRGRYAAWMKHRVETTDGLFPVQGLATEIIVDERRAVRGVALADGRELRSQRVVVTTGTFLRALMHQGTAKTPGGRSGEGPAGGLSHSLADLGLRLVRLKTGTPPRLHADSIDFAECEPQPGDDPPRSFSFHGPPPGLPQVACWIAHTTAAAHDAIRDNLHLAPMYNGQISSTGPRYCPSIEDKVVRFADRERHHLFLEPEGLETREIYVNGLSTSLPIAVQDAVLRAIPAFADAHVLRYGYAVEYDAVTPDQLDHRLACRAVPGLFLAGQINGTSGYEEAAIQGLLAGANAVLSLDERRLVLGRDQAYAGVLVDDLVTRVPDEPYRMFTSRAEHRLHLRSDNADRRLIPLAAEAGLVDRGRAAAVADKAAAVAALLAGVDDQTRRSIAGRGLDFDRAAVEIPELAAAEPAIAEGAWIELRYVDYLERQRLRLRRLERMRDQAIPADVDFAAVPGLSNEARARLADRAPASLGEAANLPGVAENDLENLWAWLRAGSPA